MSMNMNRQRDLPALHAQTRQAGFTLVETLAAITLITIAIVAPMALTVQSLEAAFFARDQITAANFAQEGIEAVRSVRDGNVLALAESQSTSSCGGTLSNGILTCIPVNQNFTIDATQIPAALTICSSGCQLKTNGQLYGYNAGWTTTNFTRLAIACFVQTDGTCNSTVSDEMRLTVTVSWQTSAYKSQQLQLSENLYNWVQAGSAT